MRLYKDKKEVSISNKDIQDLIKDLLKHKNDKWDNVGTGNIMVTLDTDTNRIDVWKLHAHGYYK